LYGSAFNDKLTLGQTAGQIVLGSVDTQNRFWSYASENFASPQAAAALPSDTVTVSLAAGDTVTVGQLDTAGADLIISVSGDDQTVTFAGDLQTQGGSVYVDTAHTRQYEFSASNVSDNVITLAATAGGQPFRDGDKVIYRKPAGGEAIGGLTDGGEYLVDSISSSTTSSSFSFQRYVGDGVYITLQLDATGATGSHTLELKSPEIASEINVSAGITISTRQADVSGASSGDSGDIVLIGKTVNVFGGANLLAHDTRSLPDPLGVPAGITAAASPTAAWAGNTIYRNVSVSGGTGKGLRVDIRTDTDGVPTVMLRDPGTGYTVGDVLTVSEPKTGSVSTITVTVSRLLERGGDITLAAADVFAAWNYGPSDAKAELTIHDGAVLKGRDVELLAEASNNERQISVDALNPADTPNTGDKILDFLRQLRLFVGVQESEAIATVTVNAATIEAVGGNVRTTADARSAALSLPVGPALAVSYANSNAESTVTINTGATITASAGDVTLLSLNNNTVSSKPVLIKSELLKFLPINAVVAVAYSTQKATASVMPGATIQSHGDIHVIADATRSIDVKADGKSRNVTANFSVAFAQVTANATAIVNGELTSDAGDVTVQAGTNAAKN
ncbi:hypothetical protein EBU58_10640, partial [bacterium]|nr:hypothetical protein [bacterium]